MDKTIGQRIKAARKAKGLTQGQLAEKAGCTSAAVSRYELDQRHDLNMISRLAIAIGCHLSELVGEADVPLTERASYRKSVCCDGHVTLWTPIKSEDAS